MKSKIIHSLSLFLENNLSEKQLSKVQEFLLSGDIEIVASKFLAVLIFFILFADVVIGIFIVFLKISDLYLFVLFIILPHLRSTFTASQYPKLFTTNFPTHAQNTF